MIGRLIEVFIWAGLIVDVLTLNYRIEYWCQEPIAVYLRDNHWWSNASFSGLELPWLASTLQSHSWVGCLIIGSHLTNSWAFCKNYMTIWQATQRHCAQQDCLECQHWSHWSHIPHQKQTSQYGFDVAGSLQEFIDHAGHKLLELYLKKSCSVLA